MISILCFGIFLAVGFDIYDWREKYIVFSDGSKINITNINTRIVTKNNEVYINDPIIDKLKICDDGMKYITRNRWGQKVYDIVIMRENNVKF